MAAAPMADVELREYRPGDETAILATFNLVFREVCGDSYVDRTLERWRWEFADNPQGMRVMLAVTSDGLVAGQYAGVPMRVWSAQHGRELSFFHAVDSMVHPDYRKGLRKKSLFIEVAERYFETWGGVADELGQASLDGHVDVLVFVGHLEVASLQLGRDRVETVVDRAVLVGGQHPDGEQASRVGARPGDVFAPQADVEGDRLVDRVECGGGCGREAAAPGVFDTGHGRTRDGFRSQEPSRRSSHQRRAIAA